MGVLVSTLAATGPRPLAEPLGRDYLLASAPDPGAGVVLWRPILTPHGLTVGVLSDRAQLSPRDPPFVFHDVAHARAVLTRDRRSPAQVLPLDHLPDVLARQLAPAPAVDTAPATTGPHVYVRHIAPDPRLRASSPEPFGALRAAAPSQTPDLHPTWYVSPHAGGAFAWQPVDAQNLACLLVSGGDGTWRPARWRDVDTALQALGRAGVWAQRAATVDPSPPALTRSSRLRL